MQKKRKNNLALPVRFYVLLILIFISSCKQGSEIRIVEETWPSGREKTIRFYREKGENRELVREIKYYENGRKETEGSFRKEQRHGKWTYWYDNGNPWSEGEFRNGLSHGQRRVYHPNGKLYYEGKFRNDKPVGTWKFYDEFGRFIKEETYD